LSAQTLLEVQGLEAAYGASQVLFGLDLQLRRGEVATLLGRNGMGKSTAIRAVLGLTPATRGTIALRGQRVERLRSDQIARMGVALVPEGRQIFPNLTVRENLIAFSRRGSSPAWNLARVFELFPLLARAAGHMGGQISGGEQQMLAIGRALMTNPDLLILDEATEGLAPLIVQEIWRVIGQIRETGISTLIVDRNYRMVLAHTDLAVVLEKGRIVLAGESAALAQDHDALGRYLGV